MNFGFSGEMIFIFFLALILFGPKKMPEIGRQVGRLLNEFRRASNEFRAQIESEVNSLDMSGKAGTSGSRPQILPPLQAPLGSLANRIFNPPSSDKASAEKPAAEKREIVENDTAEKTGEAEMASPISTVATELAPSPEPASVSKVAPDA